LTVVFWHRRVPYTGCPFLRRGCHWCEMQQVVNPHCSLRRRPLWQTTVITIFRREHSRVLIGIDLRCIWWIHWVCNYRRLPCGGGSKHIEWLRGIHEYSLGEVDQEQPETLTICSGMQNRKRRGTLVLYSSCSHRSAGPQETNKHPAILLCPIRGLICPARLSLEVYYAACSTGKYI
jgi:hypothetical protein